MRFNSQRTSRRFNKEGRRRPGQNIKGRRLRFEGLEDRQMLSATSAPELLDVNSIANIDIDENNPGTYSSVPTFLTQTLAGEAYFFVEPGSFPDSNGSYSNPIYLDGALWKTDGTDAGTVQVSVNPQYPGFVPGLGGAIVFKDELYFSATNYSDNGTFGGSWRTNGTTVELLNFLPDINFSRSMVFNDKLYFGAIDGTNGFELWKTDGTADGTSPVKNINPDGDSNPHGFAVLNNELYFTADDGTGFELWKIDSVTGETVPITNINEGGGSSPYELTVLNDDLYFAADDGTGFELWKIDSVTGETVPVTNINQSGLSNLQELTVVNDELYFCVDDSENGFELWKTNGTEPGTFQTKINAHVGNGLTVFQNELYFVAPPEEDLGYGSSELWKVNATEPGTEQLTFVTSVPRYDGPNGVFPPLIATDNFLVFAANDGTHGVEPWVIRALAPEVTAENLAQTIADLPLGTTEVRGTATASNLSDFIAAIAALPANTGDQIDIVLNLTEGDYAGAVVNVPAGYRVVLNSESQQVVFHGASPALTLQSGDLLVTGITLVNNTDAASFLVTGGSLTVRNNTIVETTGGTRAAVEITGGTADLGTLGDPGGNTLVVSGTGEFIRNATASTVPAVGNVFQIGTTTISSDVTLAPQKHLVFDVTAGGLSQLSNVQIVTIDLRPTSLNIDQNGALSLVIFGSSLFNVTQVNSGSLKLAGVSINAFNQSFSDANGDGYADLVVSFRSSEALKAALTTMYSDLLVEDAEDGEYSTRQDAVIALDGAFGEFGEEFHGTDSTTLFLAGKSLKALLQSLGVLA